MNGGAQFRAPGARVLVVDDVCVNLEITAFMLEPCGARADLCQSGSEAILAAKADQYDLILLDLLMPDMDGTETAKRIRELGGGNASVPIIALTGLDAEEEEFLQNGFNGLLPKPLDRENLNSVLQKWIPKEKQVFLAENHDPQNDAGIIIEGVDAAACVVRMGGSVENYARTLATFRKDGAEKIDGIKKSLEAGDLRLYTIYVHALKGAAANIGATALSNAAKALETAGNNGDRKFIDANNPQLLSSLEALLEKVDAALKTIKGGQGGNIDNDALKITLNDLSAAIESFNPSAITAAAKALRQYESVPSVERILQKVLIGEYDEAQSIVKTFF